MAKRQRRFPVKNGVEMRYTGPPRHNPYVVGPVSGTGYNASPGSVVVVDRRDVDGMLGAEWKKVTKPKPPVKKVEVKDE